MNSSYKEQKSDRDSLEGEGSFFRTQCLAIKESISNEIFKNFCNLHSDEERVQFIYNLDILHKIELPASSFEKSVDKANNLKNQGNNFFGKENYTQAVKFYGFGLIECPSKDDILLATLYANRSAAFYYLKEYKSSLQDINLALSLPYPENLQHKVQERKARCYLALNDLKNAVEAFKKALISLEKSNLTVDNRQKKERDFTIMITLLNKTLTENLRPKKQLLNNKTALPTVPNVKGSLNKKSPTASNLVRIEHNLKEGRFAVAANDIEPGDVLVVEDAHCANLVSNYSKTHCQHCFIRVTYLLPCPRCPNVVFCSLKCREIALNSYHNYECSFLDCLWTSGASIICNLAVRLITQKGLKYFLDLKKKSSAKYDPTVYNLCRHEKARTHLDFFHRSVMAVVLLKFLQNSNFFNTESTEDEIYIGGLLLHNLQMLQFNAHEVAELQFDLDFPGDLERASSKFIGGGLYPTLALFNHSCEPGIVRYFSGSKIIVRAVKPIRSGEIIAENYGPIYTQVPKSQRQQELKSQYWFDCNCVPCSQNWPLFDDMKTDVLPFRCLKSTSCSGTALVNINTDEFMFPCPECSEMICIFGSLKGLNDTEEMFKKGEKFLKNLLYKEALDVFIKIMKLLDNTLKPPYKDFCLCQQKIRSTMLTFGNVSNVKSKI